MSNVNVVVLSGNLVADPVLNRINETRSVCRFRMAVNRSYVTKAGKRGEDAYYFDGEMWGKNAETFANYMKKGRPVLVRGYLKQDSWEDKDGNKRSKIIISAEDFSFLDRKSASQSEEVPIKKGTTETEDIYDDSLENIPI